MRRASSIAASLWIAWTLAAQTTPDLTRHPVSLLEAVERMLAQNPLLQIQEQFVAIGRGQKQIATGQFDIVYTGSLLQTHTTTPLTAAQQASALESGLEVSSDAANLTTLDAGATKLFRNGISVGPRLQVSRTTDNILNQPGLNQSLAAFQITLPLLQGRGRAVVAAPETSAEFDLEASVFTRNQAVSDLLLQTTIAYWNDRASFASLEIARASESRGARFLEEVQLLVDAGRVAAGELHQLNANLAQRHAARIAAEQVAFAASQQLAISMGTPAGSIALIPVARDPFPDWVQDAPVLPERRIQEAIDAALQRRADLLAARIRNQSASVLSIAAKNGLLPRLDVTLAPGYAGLQEGTGLQKLFGSPFWNVRGANFTGGITYTFPPKNNVARGRLVQAEAQVRQTSLEANETARNIASSVVTSFSALLTSIAQVRNAHDAVLQYQAALEIEREKFPLERSSLVELLTVEDRLRSAQEAEVDARVAYAVAIAQARYATGTFIDPHQQVNTVNATIFVEPPPLFGGPS